ncbi:TIGR04211 family SH3 domain-containing protein [Agaribacterium haliotis]|uniref:TIGR04211 family SH3 domain-containing protein n=1 Tax=Agaribacterium haliotis TaxID=2013869 RepID=UPI0013044542|nr:TIGR04211 family SH3 domain-containing protein [Agaribacterium haliotis]
MKKLATFFACAWLFAGANAQATSLWVKDVVYVPLRSGPSSQNRILHKGLISGTEVKAIGGREQGWIEVRTKNGREGWLPEQYLLDQPTAQIKLLKAQKVASDASAKLSELETLQTSLSAELRDTKKQLEQTEKEKQQFNLELHRIKSISSGAIELDQNYQKLLEQHQLLQTENDSLNAENATLKADRRSSYMYNGAILIIIGMLMAVIIPRLKPKKRHSEWT